MTDYKPLLDSLTQLLLSRLAFRKANPVSDLQEVVGHAVKTGNIGNGRLGTVVAQVYENEARCRAELIAGALRQSFARYLPRLRRIRKPLRQELSWLRLKPNCGRVRCLWDP